MGEEEEQKPLSEVEEKIDENFILNNNIKVFKEIADNLSGCMKEEDKFTCQGCEHFDKCFKVLNECVAAISLWLASYVEETQKHKKRFSYFLIEGKKKGEPEGDFYI